MLPLPYRGFGEAALLSESFSMSDCAVYSFTFEWGGTCSLTITRIQTQFWEVTKIQKDLGQNLKQSWFSVFWFLVVFVFKKSSQREKGRDETAESRCGLIGSRCLALGTETALLLSTGPGHPAMAKPLNTLVVAAQTAGSAGPVLLWQPWTLRGTIMSYQAKPITQFDIRNPQVASSNKDNLKGTHLLMHLTGRLPG